MKELKVVLLTTTEKYDPLLIFHPMHSWSFVQNSDFYSPVLCRFLIPNQNILLFPIAHIMLIII